MEGPAVATAGPFLAHPMPRKSGCAGLAPGRGRRVSREVTRGFASLYPGLASKAPASRLGCLGNGVKLPGHHALHARHRRPEMHKHPMSPGMATRHVWKLAGARKGRRLASRQLHLASARLQAVSWRRSIRAKARVETCATSVVDASSNFSLGSWLRPWLRRRRC